MKRISLSEDAIASTPLDEGKDEEKDSSKEDNAAEETDQDEEKQAVVAFHVLADAVHEVLGEIQGLVKKKHADFTATRG